MKPEKLLKSLKTSASEELMEEIERTHPADWDATDAFEKSYSAYSGEQLPALRRKPVWKIACALAGSALVIGAAAILYLPLQKIDTKPAETTETVTETTAAATAASITSFTTSVNGTTVQTTARQETSTRMTTTFPGATPLHDAVPATTALPRSVMPTVRTTPAPVQTEATIPTVFTPETAPPMTAYFAMPVRTEAFITAATDATGEAAVSSTEMITQPVEPHEEPVNETAIPVHSEHLSLENFHMQQLTVGLSMEMTYTGALSPSPEEFVYYHSTNESFTEQPTSSPSEEMHCYVFEDTDGTLYRIIQSVREEFSFRYDRGSTPEPVKIAGHAGMFLLPKAGEMPYTALYWDDGSYTFSMTAWEAKPERMQALAGSLVPVSQTSETGKEESP